MTGTIATIGFGLAVIGAGIGVGYIGGKSHGCYCKTAGSSR